MINVLFVGFSPKLMMYTSENGGEVHRSVCPLQGVRPCCSSKSCGCLDFDCTERFSVSCCRPVRDPNSSGHAAPSAAPPPRAVPPVPPVPPALSVPFAPSAPRLARPACPACSVRLSCSSRLSRSPRLPRPPRLLAPFVLRRPSPPASGVAEAYRSVVFGVGKRLMPTSRLFRCSRIRNNREVGGFWPISTKLAVISDRDSAK